MSDSEYEDDITNDFNDYIASDTNDISLSINTNERYNKLGFKPQKELPWNKYLPYTDDNFDDESQLLLQNIKMNLAKAIAMSDIKPGVVIYTTKLIVYIKLYGLKFSKEDHINFIKTFIKLICLEGLGPSNVHTFCVLLNQLLKKTHILSPNDLQIEWKPLYRLFEIYLHKTSNKGSFYQFYPKNLKLHNKSKNNIDMKLMQSIIANVLSTFSKNLGGTINILDFLDTFQTLDSEDQTDRLQCNLRTLIRHCSIYFPKSSTQEIIGEILPKLQPLDTGKSCQIFEMLNLFLNYHHNHELWFDDFMNVWNTYHNPSWSEDMMKIMSNLAYKNIGKIDWEPHLPIMFSRILRWLDLPVTYKNLKVSRTHNVCTASISKWIIAVLGPNTSGQKYLTKFIGAIETYIHPANTGKWVKTIGQILVGLPEYFTYRLEYERYRKPYWREPVPDSYKLTEKCITDFVESLKSAAFQVMYSRIDLNEACKMFRNLSNLRPELILPDVIDRVYSNLESLTEPHRLTASLQCLVGISRALICGHNNYTVGRTHIIPILLATLPGIDPNDMKKAFLTMNFYGAFIFQMTLVDCSKAGQYYDNLTEEEALICEQTANLEDFLLQFIDRLFLMIKFNTQENVRMEQTNTDNHRSRHNLVVEGSITSGLQILVQCSEEILLPAARKVTDFVQTNVLEPQTGATLVGALVMSFAQVSGPYIFKTLVPYLTDKLLHYINEHDDIENIEKQSDDFLYYLTIYCYLYKGDPREVTKYIDDSLIPILDNVIKFKCKLTQKMTCVLIFNTLTNLSRLQIFNNKSNDENLKKPLSEYLPIRYWGEKMKSSDKFDWYIPNEKERLICEKILHRYLPNILEKFQLYINGEIETINREDLLRDLNYILSFISMSNFLPNWNDKLMNNLLLNNNTVVDLKAINITLGFDNKTINMPNGDNVRLTILNTILKLQDKLLNDSCDDIQSLKSIVLILDRVHTRKSYINSYENELKAYGYLKRFQDFRLQKQRTQSKLIISKRVLVQQTCRDELSLPNYTIWHKEILKYLLKLSTSYYSAVRILAQSKLFQFLNTYKFSYYDIIDDLVELLQHDSIEYHEQFKGALCVIIGSMWTRLLIKNNWLCIEKLWLNILKSKPSEKPSIIRLLDTILYILPDEFTTITISLNVTDDIIECGLKLVNTNGNLKNFIITEQDIENGKKLLKEKNDDNIDCYNRILNSIVDLTKNTNLHWRYHYMATTMLLTLVHPSVKYPTNVVKYVVNNLINDSIKERKLSIGILNAILKQQKRTHVRIKIDPFEVAGVKRSSQFEKLSFGIRDDNRWLQYDLNTLPKNQNDWDKPYVHKCDGFFGWSTNFEIYAPSNQQPKLERQRDEMNDIEKIIYDFFIDKDNLNKFVKYLSLEENKGKEKIKEQRFSLFKYLFKIYGDAFFDNFLPHLENLIKENRIESNHRCAAEILSGIMRGMKHWPYDKTKNTYEKLIPIIHLALDNVTTETDDFWGTCFATASEHIDPRKQYWLHEVLIEDPLRESTSFVDCCRIFCLQGTFNQHVWRMDSYAHRLLNYLKPYLNHSFQNVRVRLSSMLINVFEADFQFDNGNPPECPRIKDMIDEVVDKLKPLKCDIVANTMNLSKSEAEKSDTSVIEEQKKYDEAIRLYKTICQWIIGVVSRSTNGNEISYFDLLPYVCRLESSEQDTELSVVSTSLLALMSQALTLPNRMDYGLEKFDVISKSSSWNSRLAIIDALQVLVFHNMSIILSKDEWIQKVQNIVLRLLEDTSVEVREKAAQVLGGLLHCSFLPATDKLLEQFKQKCKTKVVRRNQYRSVDARTTTDTSDTDAVRMRHAGVLGLCAFISAFPYDIPDFVPDVFEHLGAHLNDPQPIPSTIRKTVGDFKRTHHENWAIHQLKFTEDQLAVLSDLTIPPSYYT